MSQFHNSHFPSSGATGKFIELICFHFNYFNLVHTFQQEKVMHKYYQAVKLSAK